MSFAYAESCCHGIWRTGSNRVSGFFHISRHFGLRCMWRSFPSVILNVFIIFRFLIWNTVDIIDQPFQVILKKSYPFLRREMLPKALWCCPHHGHWGQSDLTDLRTATEPKLKFCEVDKDGQQKGRKRKICPSCQNRIQLEVKCYKLEVGSCFCICKLLVTELNVFWLSRDKCATWCYCQVFLEHGLLFCSQ